jgi:predicted AAA+ superfamily ATPase
LKVALDGSIEAASENVLIYATSNRRHLMPEYMQENLETRHLGEEIHPGEAVEEKVSLSERFGLWVSFYPFDQDEYLAITGHWLEAFGCNQRDLDAARQEAIQWALQRGRAAAASPGNSRAIGRAAGNPGSRPGSHGPSHAPRAAAPDNARGRR